MGERVKILRKALGLTQEEFSERLKIKRNTIAKYETGRGDPIDAVVSLLCHEFNVNELWLRTGEGDMFHSLTRDEEIASFVGSLLSVENDSFKLRFISILSHLSEDEWDWLESKAKKLAGLAPENKQKKTD